MHHRVKNNLRLVSQNSSGGARLAFAPWPLIYEKFDQIYSYLNGGMSSQPAAGIFRSYNPDPECVLI